MTTKAKFKCENCGFEKEFSICSMCLGAIDLPHNQHPNCEKCGGKMGIVSGTVRKE